MAKLTKVDKPPERYFHVFDVSGTQVEVETTQADYHQLGTKQHINPTYPGGVWKHSLSSIIIEPGTYCDDSVDTIIVNNEGTLLCVKKEDVIDDTLTADGLAKLEEFQRRFEGIPIEVVPLPDIT